MTSKELNGKMVEIISGDQGCIGFVGRAVDDDGWIGVDLNAVDLEDDRMVYPVSPDDVKLRPDLDEIYG